VGAAATFPLVPRWQPAGSTFGRLRTARRGRGTSVSGNRTYRPGDDTAAIDWKTSARLSAARGNAEFIVREHFADEAPRTVVVADRRPSMGLHGDDLPWLDKATAVREVWGAVAVATAYELGLAGWLDGAGGHANWFPPATPDLLWRVDAHVAAAAFDAPETALVDAFAHLGSAGLSVPTGTFLFVCSDFLVAPEPRAWLRLLARRWDVVPVVVQDPTWERSFPAVDGLVLPLRDAAGGPVRQARIHRGESARRREEHERRFASLVDELSSVGLEAVVVSSAEPEDVLTELSTWAELRLAQRRGAR
jgi:uncharacterized protein (DUF58 family)